MSTDLGKEPGPPGMGGDPGGKSVTNPPGSVGKAGRQALYLAYRAMPAGLDGRMTQAQAAKLAGVDTATVSRWRRTDVAFRVREGETQREGVERAKHLARGGAEVLLGAAIQQLAEILDGKTMDVALRAQVAMKVLEWNGAASALEVDIKDDGWAVLQRRLIGAE